MDRAEKRSQKRKEVVEAVVVPERAYRPGVACFQHSCPDGFRLAGTLPPGGLAGVDRKKPPRSPQESHRPDLKWLYDAVTLGNPLNYKLPFCLWTANTIRALLEKERGLRLSKSGVCRLLAHLGLSPQRPFTSRTSKTPTSQNLSGRNLS